MTLSISQPAFDELFDEMATIAHTQYPDLADSKDFINQYPPLIGDGYWRTIQLREGLQLVVGDLLMHDRLLIPGSECKQGCIEYHFHLSGKHQDGSGVIGAGEYGVRGAGLEQKAPSDYSSREPFLEVLVWMDAAMFGSFIGNEQGQLPIGLQHLIRPVEQVQYLRTGKATTQMHTVARQIVNCPYQGIVKRMYFEGKALELMSLLVAAEMALGDNQPMGHTKTATIDRVHYARDILLQRTANPPTLGELARLSGLNEYSLKCGFRQVFGTTVFGYLHQHNMEQAQQLLQMDDRTVEDVARLVGYSNLSAFGWAFRKQFGMCPRDFRSKKSFE